MKDLGVGSTHFRPIPFGIFPFERVAGLEGGQSSLAVEGWARSYDIAQLNASLFRLHNKIDALVTMGLEVHQAPSEGPRSQSWSHKKGIDL